MKLQLDQAYAEINALRNENENLKEKLKERDLTMTILNNNKKLQFFTGVKEKKLFDFLVLLVKNAPNNIKTLSLETQVLIVLMKLKLNLLNTDLAFRFHTSRKTIQRVFDALIPALASKLKTLIKWPTKDALQSNMPNCF